MTREKNCEGQFIHPSARPTRITEQCHGAGVRARSWSTEIKEKSGRELLVSGPAGPGLVRRAGTQMGSLSGRRGPAHGSGSRQGHPAGHGVVHKGLL